MPLACSASVFRGVPSTPDVRANKRGRTNTLWTGQDGSQVRVLSDAGPKAGDRASDLLAASLPQA